MESKIEQYIEEMKNRWAPSTLSSERHRLLGLKDNINGNPPHLWNVLSQQSPYTRLTTWLRVSNFWGWLHPSEKENVYEGFKKKNARLFKNAYERKKPSISFEEAHSRIQSISDPQYRGWAMALLSGGMRVTESKTLDLGRVVVGKGSKRRQIYSTYIDGWEGATGLHAHTLRRRLSAVGLKPHDLRKLFATRIVERGGNAFELCGLMGWSSIETAQSYIGLNEERISKLVE
jgi:integrase